MNTDNETAWTDASKIKPKPYTLCVAVGPNGPQVAVFHNMMGSDGDFATITVMKDRKTCKRFAGVMWWMYLTAWPESHQQGEVKT